MSGIVQDAEYSQTQRHRPPLHLEKGVGEGMDYKRAEGTL